LPALLVAATEGHEAVVKLLLDSGKVDGDRKDDAGRTPLLYAAGKGHGAVVKLLLDSGKADVNCESFFETPMLCAGMKGKRFVTKGLLNRTPLSWAAAEGDEAVVKVPLDSGKVGQG